MCIFSQPVASVDSTRIFARVTSRATQFLVYQMNYESIGRNAMILPLPVRHPVSDASLRFIDLQDYAGFFEDLSKGFPYRRSSFDVSCAARPDGLSTLPVYEVGNFIASFVPSQSEFSRLDGQFVLPTSTWSKLPQYADYGFAVFQLADGTHTPHQMAFEFDCRDSSIYFPTLHIHDGDVPEYETFDHHLYLQHAGFDSRAYEYQNYDVIDAATRLIRSSDVAATFCDVARAKQVVEGRLLVHYLPIDGPRPNQDTVVATTGDPEIKTYNWRRWRAWSPVALTAAAIWWIVRRRVRRMSAVEDAGEDSTDDDISPSESRD